MTDPSHQASADPGSPAAPIRQATATASRAQPSTTMSVYRTKAATSRATNPASPAPVRRDGEASVASTAHGSAPVPAAISAASVNVGM
jgi:hypothetical protein